MTPFVKVRGVAAPLRRSNIDTDQITPGHTGMKVQKTGFGSGLFYNWRYLQDGRDNPDFILNQAPFRSACFLVTGANFGCGSSREFAVWALRDFGIRAVIASSFGPIFTANCFTNGLLPVILDEERMNVLASEIAPEHAQMTVDLQDSVITTPAENRLEFRIPALQRERLLEGLDPIDATRKREALIARFQECDAERRPWVYRR